MIAGPFKTALTAALLATLGAFPTHTAAREQDPPVYLNDRGTGLPTSMFGTYIRKGELLIYPFVEGYRDDNKEYKPSELGFGLDQDFRGKYRAFESLVFVGYGVTDWLAVEFEASAIKASLLTAPDDDTGLPDQIEESGIGDIEGQVRMRLLKERAGRPEVFSYVEAVAPNARDKQIIGTPNWEYKFGGGIIKGSRVGTFTVRIAAEYSVDESSLGSGEYAVKYFKRLSPAFRFYFGLEGNEDEGELINEVQWHFNDRVFLKINNGFGVTSKATDWAPEIGIMFSLPARRDD